MTKPNVEMFKRVVERIEAAPEQHYQGVYSADWSLYPEGAREGNYCGTTRCVGGWGLFLWAKDNGLNGNDFYGIVQAYAKRNGVEWEDAHSTAAHLFGLSYGQSFQLFYEMNEAKALEMAKIYASGGIPEPDEGK